MVDDDSPWELAIVALLASLAFLGGGHVIGPFLGLMVDPCRAPVPTAYLEQTAPTARKLR